MKAEDFINQQIKAGYKIHFHQGVWWEKVAPFFYKPVLPYQEISPRESRPRLARSFFGYNHCVPDSRYAKKVWPVTFLCEEKLKNFSIRKLSLKTKRSVRKGLKNVNVRRIEIIDNVIEDMKDICISTAERTKHGKPPHYYLKNYNEWKVYIFRLFNLPNREWWGAFCEGKLVAYIYAYKIGDTMYVDTHKSHTEFLKLKPNDALYFTFIEYCKNLLDCNSVNSGDWNKINKGVNVFKMKYGFEKVDLPVYTNYNPFVSLAIKFLRN